LSKAGAFRLSAVGTGSSGKKLRTRNKKYNVQFEAGKTIHPDVKFKILPVIFENKKR